MAAIATVALLGLLVLVLCWVATLVLPFGLLLLGAGRTPLRHLLTLMLGYLLLSSVAGGLAYALLPAEYTRFSRWTLHPAANSLGEIHAVDLQRLGQPGAYSPPAAARRHTEIAAERRQFVRRWGGGMAIGLGCLVLGFAGWWGGRRLHQRRGDVPLSAG